MKVNWKLFGATIAAAMVGFVSAASAQETESDEAEFSYTGSSIRLRDDCGCDKACGCDDDKGGGKGDDCGDKGDDCDGKDAKGGCSCYLFGPDEAFGLFPADDCRRIAAGGWFQAGYHTAGRNNVNGGGTGLFNNRPNEVQLQQAWAWVERAVDTGGCGTDWGFRVDYVYGTDAQNTQAFGSRANDWDTQWDNGSVVNGYGHAIPQAYLEFGYNDIKIKAGHFFTIIGYEVVPAPDNFFYSHSNTMVLNEPFTHTGVLVEWAYSDNVTVYGGWTQGWDTGFSDNGGNSFLGGISVALTDNASITWALIYGDFGFGAGGSDNDAYMNSIVFDWNITDRLEYVFQHDYQNNNALGGTGTQWAINQYLFYTINDCLAAGVRAEYDNFLGNELGEVTAGINWRPHANVIIRPEVRVDLFETGLAPLQDSTLFGIDAIVTW